MIAMQCHEHVIAFLCEASGVQSEVGSWSLAGWLSLPGQQNGLNDRGVQAR